MQSSIRMGLDLSMAGGGAAPSNYEDLNDYTEVDTGGYLSITDNYEATITAMPGNITSYFYKDFGEGYFEDYEIWFDIIQSAYSGANDGGFAPILLSNYLGSAGDHSAFYKSYAALNHCGNRITQYVEDKGVDSNLVYDGWGAQTHALAYGKLIKSSTTVTYTLYSDAERTTQLGTSFVTVLDMPFRYLQIATSRESASAGIATGYVKNVEIKSVTSFVYPTEPIEDLTTFTEADPNSEITVTESRVTLNALNTNASAWVYKDYGAGYFGSTNLEITWEMELTADTASDPTMPLCFLSNTPNATQLAHNTADDGAGAYVHRGARVLYYALEYEGGTSTQTALDTGGVSPYPKLYFTLLRSGTTTTVKVFLDKARKQQIGATANVTGTSEAYRYLYVFTASGATGGTFTGYLENFRIIDRGV